MHGDDPVGQCHRLDLVVRDVDRGRAEIAVQFLDLGPHLLAQPRVEIGQRLVEQERLGLPHDGAAHRHALALATRQRLRPALQQRLQPELLGSAADRGGDPLAGRLADAQAVAHVLGDVHMRIERVGLEHHGDVAILRRALVDAHAADPDFA